ncbi:hypothetical protein TB2_046934 [Malus domestica]
MMLRFVLVFGNWVMPLYLANQEKFHKEANEHYWNAIAKLILREVPNIEKKRGKKDPDKKPSIVVIQCPKPGKPTDLSKDAVDFPEAETEASATHDAAPTCRRWPGCKGRKRWKGYKITKDAKDAGGGKDAMEGGKDAKERKDVKNGKINSQTLAGAAAASASVSPAKDVTVNCTPGSSKPEAPAEPEGEQHSETTPTPAK